MTINQTLKGMRYLYGPMNADAELVLDRALDEVRILPENGAGPSRFGEISFNSGAYTYTAYYSFELFDDRGDLLPSDPDNPYPNGSFKRGLTVIRDIEAANPVFRKDCLLDHSYDALATLQAHRWPAGAGIMASSWRTHLSSWRVERTETRSLPQSRPRAAVRLHCNEGPLGAHFDRCCRITEWPLLGLCCALFLRLPCSGFFGVSSVARNPTRMRLFMPPPSDRNVHHRFWISSVRRTQSKRSFLIKTLTQRSLEF
ncbi:hypothetical protein Q0601_05235 [Paracoccus onubensis]|uniref:hypothetical protein n=1 Tax=Paracoccus onubensis TaxID=1675788 RepID=UPI002730FB3B|nr:hypothetical protein [Paracoccus onubensis]MDP0926563.1 hypothetical protein [Paracoccus onubensis]